MVEYCAARGGTEEDAVRYGLAAHGVIDKLLVGVGFAGVKTLTKRGKMVRLTKVDAINLSKKTYRDKVSAERINQTPKDDVFLTPYGRPGGGHHIHMKSAYQSHPKYDLRKALCLSNEEMARLGINHDFVTIEQRLICTELRRSGKPMTREAMNEMSVKALMAGGASEQIARDIVARSQWDLKTKDVRHPTDMPWGGKKQ